MKKIDKLIINSPYVEPQQYWEYIRDNREFLLQQGRRPAGYVVASETSKSFDDPGIFIEIDLVNTIRPRIKKWRDEGYPGVTGITKCFCNGAVTSWYKVLSSFNVCFRGTGRGFEKAPLQKHKRCR